MAYPAAMSTWFVLLAQLAVLAYAIVGGVFLAFSDFIMRALARTSPHGGVEAMQMINREVFRYVFIPTFLALVPLSALLLVSGVVWPGDGGGWLIAAAGAIYLLGAFAVTGWGNVPMNQKLDGMDPGSDGAQRYWRETYRPRWTALNTVRTLACLSSALLLQTALIWFR